MYEHYKIVITKKRPCDLNTTTKLQKESKEQEKLLKTRPLISVYDAWNRSPLSWRLETRRSLKDEEIEGSLDLLSSLSSFNPSLEEDVRSWSLGSAGGFSVCSLHKHGDLSSILSKDYCSFL